MRFQRPSTFVSPWFCAIITALALVSATILGSAAARLQTQQADDDRAFHTYAQMTTELQTIAATYPSIARLYDMGHSVQGRSLWALKITDNPDIEEDEPEVRICGLHHGNEYMGAELPLLLAQHLTANYSVPAVANLVDNREIWIIPMVNPDGREAGSRYNSHGVDLNRDYGYMWEASSSPGPFSQPETQVMRANALDHNYVLSLSYHCSGDIVNYIWNYKPQRSPDQTMVLQLSNQYASYNGYWVTEGYDWYQTKGDCNDFSYGCRGDIDWTIEVQTSDIQGAWVKNKPGMLDIITAADVGLRGVITDAATGEPVDAMVFVEGVYWPAFTDPDVGDYHRVLPPGSYYLYVWANGYQEQLLGPVTVGTGSPATVLDIQMARGGPYFAHQVTWCDFRGPDDYANNPTEGIAALRCSDGACASVGVSGTLVLDMKDNITDAPGAMDLRIYEGECTQDGYTVYVATAWNGPWTSLGSGIGNTEFDLASASVQKARFVKLVDDGDGSASESHPGADFDAVENLAPETTNLPPEVPAAPQGPSQGFTYAQYEFSAVAPHDPDGPEVYLRFAYGDGTESTWLGPYTEGTEVSQSYMWTQTGAFAVQVRAKDLNGSMSAWSQPLQVTLTQRPKINVTAVRGGFGIAAEALNQGSENLTGVLWSVIIDGTLVLYASGTSGMIQSLAAGQTATVKTGLLFGLGRITIQVTIGDGTKTAEALLFGPFVLKVTTT